MAPKLRLSPPGGVSTREGDILEAEPTSEALLGNGTVPGVSQLLSHTDLAPPVDGYLTQNRFSSLSLSCPPVKWGNNNTPSTKL